MASGVDPPARRAISDAIHIRLPSCHTASHWDRRVSDSFGREQCKLHLPRGPLEAWFADVRHAAWNGPAGVKADFGGTVVVADNRVIFDIAGNEYRLVAHIAYGFKRMLVKFVGTHAEYDRIDPETVR